MSNQYDKDISVIRVHQARDSRARDKGVKNHKRISLSVTELYLWNRISLCGCI